MKFTFVTYALLVLLNLFLPCYCSSASFCTFDSDVKKIYNQILNLDLDLARVSLGNKPETSPNKAYLLLENEIDFYLLFIHEQKTEYEKRKSNKNKRLDQIDESDLPIEWKRFLKAEILLQWALVHSKQEEDYQVFQCLRKSLNLLEENAKSHPQFMYTYKSLGILHTVLSTIPSGFQWVAGLLGLSGNLYSGKHELLKYIQFGETSDDIFIDESYAAMSFIIAYFENNPEKGYQYCIKKMGSHDLNPLQTLVQVNLAMKAGRNDDALYTLQKTDNSSKDKFPYLYFLIGLTKLRKLDPDADQYFQKFLRLHKGIFSIKEAYQKLAWSALLKGQKALYHLHISQSLNKGNAITDEDKNARMEAASSEIPDVHLLKARLLFDGGYFNQAYEMIYPKIEEYYANPQTKMECAYRLGRICQMKKEYERALQFYKDVFQFEPQYNSYMSCNALLQCGIILENQNKKMESIVYYEKVLQVNPNNYKRSIQQKAKAGLARLKK